jgi:hypothetical protein
MAEVILDCPVAAKDLPIELSRGSRLRPKFVLLDRVDEFLMGLGR